MNVTIHQKRNFMLYRKQAYTAAFLGGVFGAIAITMLSWAARFLALSPFDFSLLLGSMVTGGLGAGSWILGFLMHLTFGGIFGLGYAYAFEKSGKTGASTGAAYSVAHWVAAGIILGLLPMMHVLIPEVLAEPGFFALNYGLASMLLVLAVHVVYGAIVGTLHEQAVIQSEASKRTEFTDPYRNQRAA